MDDESATRRELALELMAMAEELSPGITRNRVAFAAGLAIHHIDGDPRNNDPANLMFVAAREGAPK